MIIVVDGYNLLRRAYPEFLVQRSFEAAREAMVARLERYFEVQTGTQMIIVFDGATGAWDDRPSRRGFRVAFSRPPRSADDEILALCRHHEGRDEIEIVTSDFADIGRRISGLRCRHSSSEEFARRVEKKLAPRADSGSSAAPEKPTGISGAEADEFLRAFDLHPEADEP
jgi:predicted RNA-binding protein with PIN domain